MLFCKHILPLNIPGVLGEPLWVSKVSLGTCSRRLICLNFTYQRASTRPVELLKEEIALNLLHMNIDALEMVQDEKHNNNINETNHNKVDTSDSR